MVLNWIKRILGIVITPSNENDGDKIALLKPLDKEHSLQELDNRKRIVQEGKEKIKLSSINWYKIFIPKRVEKKPNNIFQAYKFSKVSTLKELKEFRLRGLLWFYYSFHTSKNKFSSNRELQIYDIFRTFAP